MPVRRPAGRAVQAALRLAAGRTSSSWPRRATQARVLRDGRAGARDQVSLPGWYGDDILTVGAVGPDDAPAAFTVPGPWVDVAAPGTGLRSLAVGGGTTGRARRHELRRAAGWPGSPRCSASASRS